MMPHKTTLAALLAAILFPPCANAREKPVLGPEPEWGRYKDLAEDAVRARLPDPDAWQIAWPNGYMKATWSHHGKFDGYLTCGVLSAIKPVEGRYPHVNFVAVVDYDKVQTIDISTDEHNSKVNIMCSALVRQGKLPPASVMPVTQDHSIGRLGLTVRPVPQGAYIVSAAADQPAARAGLIAGTVITQVNGVALAGMDEAMAKVLDSAADPLVLTTAAGRTVHLGASQP